MDRQTILFIVFLLIVLATGYVLYFYFSNTPSFEGKKDLTTDVLEARLSELKRLKTLELDTAVFQDPGFKGLEEPDLTQPPEAKPGRTNPFLPL